MFELGKASNWFFLSRKSGKPAPLLHVFLTVCIFGLPAEAQYEGGTGEPNDPYLIATAEQLISIGADPNLLDKHFVLVNDIDLDPNLPGGRIFGESVIASSYIRWAHVAQVYCRPFTGIFNGNGHIICNLVIEAEGELNTSTGLFGCIEGQVRNINLENINVSGTHLVGGLTGSNNGIVTACRISGSITGLSEVGALVGSNEGTINSCHAAGVVWADEKAGGLVGYHSAGTIAFSYSITLVDGNFDVGGLVGASQEGTVHLSYWDIDTSGMRVSAGGRGKHSVEMMSREIYRGWGYPNVWTISEGADYPRLLWEAPDDELIVDMPCIYGGGTGEPNDPFQISSAKHLVSIGYCPDNLDNYFVLMDDIDLSEIDPNTIVPIGTSLWPFAGVFDGNGLVISNMVCSLNGQSCVGLFGYIGRQQSYLPPDYGRRFDYKSGIVKNVLLADATVFGGNLTGALVGLNRSEVFSCSATGIVLGQSQTGGLTGCNEGTVRDCDYAGIVEGGSEVGGLCGYNGSNGRLELCSVSGTVTGIENVGGVVGSNSGYQAKVISCYANNHVFGVNTVGGLAGYNGSNIQESYSTGNVTGQTDVGGFVGRNYDDVRACKCSGSVSGTTSVGGFVGYNPSGSITSCYTSSDVTGNNVIGGLVGQNGKGIAQYCYSFGAVIADGNEVGGLIGSSQWEWDTGDFFLCYWDIETSGMSTSRGGFGRPTSRMMKSHTFRGWAETGMWTILEGNDYPRLVWEKHAGELITNIASSYGGGTGEPNDPYQIWTCEQFIEIAHRPEDLMKCFVLMADIDMAEIDSYEIIPIGSYEVPFIGLFDGKGHTISNFRCVYPGSPHTGVFGVLGWPGYSWKKPASATGIITDLNLANAYVSGGSKTGALVGVSVGQIIDISVTGRIEGAHYVGGIVGYSNGEIRNASSETVTSGFNYIGGLVGSSRNNITNSCSSGFVSGDNKIGGLIGNQHSSSTTSSNVDSCKSTCQVSATRDFVGGLVGDNSSSIATSYSSGSVSGRSYVGGLVGQTTGNIAMCYSNGMVSGDQYVGGLVGRNWGSMTSSFWDWQTSRQPNSHGGRPLPTAWMRTARPFLEAGWDFVDETENGIEDIWWILEGQDYPRLWWEALE